jgi:hypothetical protein
MNAAADAIAAALDVLRRDRPDSWISADGRHRLNEIDAAYVLGVAPRTLRGWREAGIGPPYFRLGRVTYATADLLAFLDQQQIDPWR